MSKEIKPTEECQTLQELFADPNRWIQYDEAVTALDSIIEPTDPMAAKFCLWGGLFRIYPVQEDRTKAADRIRRLINQGISDWNDAPNRVVRDVQKIVKEANV